MSASPEPHQTPTKTDHILAAFSTLYTVTVLVAVGAFGMYLYLTAIKPLPNGAPDVVCWEMPQSDLKRGGWQRVPEVDRQQLSHRAANGKVRLREETSLQCRQYQDDDVRLFLAREWWWRAK